jgi:predicted RNA binding protein YcfA (HicA-like mRNA interferase family)
MKSISGKKFAKILERKGWQLSRVQGSITSIPNPVNQSESLFPFMAIKTSKSDCFATL